MIRDTAEAAYAERLRRIQLQRWKRLIFNPYRWKLRRLASHPTLDVGCGIGRGLAYMGPGSVGVDHNREAIATCRDRGFEAYMPDEFAATQLARAAGFETLLFSHVFEHMTPDESRSLLSTYLPALRPGGRVVSLTPQEKGFASDPTHVTFMGIAEVVQLFTDAGLGVESTESFPLPRRFGDVWIYNETIVVGRSPRVEVTQDPADAGREAQQAGGPPRDV